MPKNATEVVIVVFFIFYSDQVSVLCPFSWVKWLCSWLQHQFHQFRWTLLLLDRRLWQTSGLKQVAKSITTSEHPELVPSGAVPQNPSSHHQLDSQKSSFQHQLMSRSFTWPSCWEGIFFSFLFLNLVGIATCSHIIPGTKDDMRVMDWCKSECCHILVSFLFYTHSQPTIFSIHQQIKYSILQPFLQPPHTLLKSCFEVATR